MSRYCSIAYGCHEAIHGTGSGPAIPGRAFGRAATSGRKARALTPKTFYAAAVAALADALSQPAAGTTQ